MQVVPEVVPLTAPYWNGAREGRLMLQRCTSCGAVWHPPEPICPRCQSSAVEWTAASGAGTVHSYTVVVHPTHVAFEDRTPYLVSLVDLAEGPRLVAGIRECAPEDVYVGMPVRVVFETEGDVVLPQFVPSETTDQQEPLSDSTEDRS